MNAPLGFSAQSVYRRVLGRSPHELISFGTAPLHELKFTAMDQSFAKRLLKECRVIECPLKIEFPCGVPVSFFLELKANSDCCRPSQDLRLRSA